MMYMEVLSCLFAVCQAFEVPWVPTSVLQTIQIPSKHKLPSFLKVCQRSDPDLNGCIQNSVEQLRPRLAQGIPELSVPSCDPLYIPELVMNQGQGSMAVRYTYTDVLIHGPSRFILHDVRVDLEKGQLQVNLTLPQLRINGNYCVTGQILMLPIVGNGHSQGNYSDIQASAVIQWKTVSRFGKVYLHVDNFLLDLKIGHASILLSDLFDGDKELGDAMNLFINNNWETIAEDMKPVLEKTFGEMLKNLTNKIFHKFTFDELLPP